MDAAAASKESFWDDDEAEIINMIFERDLASVLLDEDDSDIDMEAFGGLNLASTNIGDDVIDPNVDDPFDEKDDESFSAMLADAAEEPLEAPGRGHRGPRHSRRKRDPYKSTFWTDYISIGENLKYCEENPDENIWDETSFLGAAFRRRFSVPYMIFHEIWKAWEASGEYREEKDMVGRLRIDSRILILGCLRVLTKGTPFDLIEEASKISMQFNHAFFHIFIRWFVKTYYDPWIKFPQTEEEIRHVEELYRDLALPGCIGSVDCVHVGWDMCPASMRSDCKGKEGYPTLAFQVIVSHTRKILSVTREFPGTWNDINIVREDVTVDAIRNNDVYKKRKWSFRTIDGAVGEEEGYYMVCDGGYVKWKQLMPPYKHQLPGTATEAWSSHVESIRKDVECTFGILKKRYAILKNKLRFHNKEDVYKVFVTCCILHNWLHDWDGFDNWEEKAEACRRLEEPFTTEQGDRITMRQRDYVETFLVDEDLQEDTDFGSRRSILIDHYSYLRSQNYNVNRYR